MASDWTAPASSFDAAAVTAVAPSVDAGTVIDLRRVLTDHAVQWVISHDADDTWVLFLRGSLDGLNWYDIGASYTQSSGIGSSGSATSLGIATGKPARYVRAVGYTSSGQSPTVTALVIARE